MKTCTRCKIKKELNEFFKDARTKDNKSPSCKECIYKRRKNPVKKELKPGYKQCNKCKKLKLYNEFWADKANKTDGCYSHCKECKTQSTLKWREENKEYYNKSMRDYRASQDPNARRDTDLNSWFGLPHGWYKSTLTKQNNCCAICKKPNKSTKRTLAVDHNHKTGKVRGILCYNCNRLLHAFDNIDLYNAIKLYLANHKESDDEAA